MPNEQNDNSAIESEEQLETDEKELFLLQIDEWLKVCLNDMFSNIFDDDLTETDEAEEQLGD